METRIRSNEDNFVFLGYWPEPLIEAVTFYLGKNSLKGLGCPD
jgi:hypothetical protein